jgi:type I restriction enzyme R subunit
MEELQFFDPKQDYAVAWKTLPHWAQAGTVCFITWRSGDSLPAAAERRLTQNRIQLLQPFHCDGNGRGRAELAKLSPAERARVHWSLFCLMERELDRHFGQCVLARPECSEIVAKSLHYFDGDRYVLTEFVVMPNHVHLLAAFRDEDSLLAQCESWKRFTAREINQLLGRRGEFWQVEQFDHLVRSPEHFDYFRRYIAENPKNAKLPAEKYRHYSKSL